MTGRDLARAIKTTMTAEGIDPKHTRTWTHPLSASLVTWYGMALNLAGFDYCDECGSEGPIAEMVYPFDGADCCTCRHCPPYPKEGAA